MNSLSKDREDTYDKSRKESLENYDSLNTDISTSSFKWFQIYNLFNERPKRIVQKWVSDLVYTRYH